MIRDDLEAAGIPYELNGTVFDFHALTSLSAAWRRPAYIRKQPKNWPATQRLC